MANLHHQLVDPVVALGPPWDLLSRSAAAVVGRPTLRTLSVTVRRCLHEGINQSSCSTPPWPCLCGYGACLFSSGRARGPINELHRAGGQAPLRVTIAAGTVRDGTALADSVPPTVTINVVYILHGGYRQQRCRRSKRLR